MYSDNDTVKVKSFRHCLVSIPWRGFVVFRLEGTTGAWERRCMFQSPGGDSLYSDSQYEKSGKWSNTSFNPLAGIRCIQTCRGCGTLGGYYWTRFNPLAGIRCIQTGGDDYEKDRDGKVSIPWRGFVVFRLTDAEYDLYHSLLSFNPLAGIRCIQTLYNSHEWSWAVAFQSPGGDSLYSDSVYAEHGGAGCLRVSIPWRGFVVFRRTRRRGRRRLPELVSIPWRGFVVFRLV